MENTSNIQYVTRVYEETYLYITKYLVIKCGSIDDVSDLLQNVYTAFLERVKRKGRNHILVPKHYLLKIASDELSKYYKENKRNNENLSIDDNADFDFQSDEFLEQEVDEKLLSEKLWEEIGKLDVLTIKIFTLRFLYDMKLKDISKELDCNLSVIKSRLYRGMESIRGFMDRKER